MLLLRHRHSVFGAFLVGALTLHVTFGASHWSRGNRVPNTYERQPKADVRWDGTKVSVASDVDDDSGMSTVYNDVYSVDVQ
jgi:hypothetical protein